MCCAMSKTPELTFEDTLVPFIYDTQSSQNINGILNSHSEQK